MNNVHPLIKSLLLSFNLDYDKEMEHSKHLNQMLNESEIVKRINDLDYCLLDEDRLPQSLTQHSQDIDDEPLQILNAYTDKMYKTLKSLTHIQKLIINELDVCDKFKQNYIDLTEDNFLITDEFLKDITR